MSSDAGDWAGQDFDETTSAVQDDGLEDYLGTQLEESHQEHEDMELDYDPNVPLAEAAPVPRRETENNMQQSAPYVDADPEETLPASLASMYTTLTDDRLSDKVLSSSVAEEFQRTQTSQGPSPTQRSQTATLRRETAIPSPALVIDVDELDAGIGSLNVDHQDSHPTSNDDTDVVVIQENDSSTVKREKPNDDVMFMTSNTLEEPIVISDDEDVGGPNHRDLAVDALLGPSRDQAAILNGTGGINMGNSIFRTRMRKPKPTKEQVQLMKKAQQLLAQQAKRKSVTGGPGVIFKGAAGEQDVATDLGSAAYNEDAPINGRNAMRAEVDAVTLDTDDYAWMNEELDDDSDDSVM